jgi:hypothetical protein
MTSGRGKLNRQIKAYQRRAVEMKSATDKAKAASDPEVRKRWESKAGIADKDLENLGAKLEKSGVNVKDLA